MTQLFEGIDATDTTHAGFLGVGVHAVSTPIDCQRRVIA